MSMGNCFSFVTVWLKKTRSYDPTDSLPSSSPIETYNPKSSTSNCDLPSTSTNGNKELNSQPENTLKTTTIPPSHYNGERRPSILKTDDKKLDVVKGEKRRVSFSAILDEQLHYEVDDEEEFKMGSVEEDDEDHYYRYGCSPHSYFSDFSVATVA